MLGATCTTPSLIAEPGHAVEQRQVDVLAERKHQRVGFERLEFAGRLRKALVVELHLLDREHALVHALDGREPFHHDAFLQRLFDLEVVRRHAFAGAAIDDDRLGGAQPLGGARDVDARCCRRRRRRRAGRAAACPRLPSSAAPRRRRASSRRSRPEYRRAWRYGRRPRGTPRRIVPPFMAVDDAVDLGVELQRRRRGRRCARSRHRARRAAGDISECRTASCRPRTGRPRGFRHAWPIRRR